MIFLVHFYPMSHLLLIVNKLLSDALWLSFFLSFSSSLCSNCNISASIHRQLLFWTCVICLSFVSFVVIWSHSLHFSSPCYDVVFSSSSSLSLPPSCFACRMAVICLKVPAAADSENVIKFQKNSRNASCPLPIFQGPVYARTLFLQVSTFNPPSPEPAHTTFTPFSFHYREHPLKIHMENE